LAWRLRQGQFLEQLSDRQTADAVRSRIDWKYALGLELTDPGFHFSVLTEFRARPQGSTHFILRNPTILFNFYMFGKVCIMNTVLRHHSLKSVDADASAEMQGG